MKYSITRKKYCGHWATADLERTREFKTRQLQALKNDVEDLEQDLAMIIEEEKERKATTES